MIKKQLEFSLNNETKTCIISANTENQLVKSVIDVLSIQSEDIQNDFEVVYTLGKLPMKKIIIIKEENMYDKNKGLDRIKDIKEDVLILLDTFSDSCIKQMVERLVVSNYRFNTFKTTDLSQQKTIYYTSTTDIDSKIEVGLTFGEAINHSKELVNTPYNHLNAKKLAEYASRLANEVGLEVNIYGKKECEAMNMGAFLGVNKGSIDEPQLIHLQYRGNKESSEITALVGKGVMFDTGGYSLKPSTSMPNIKNDMAGAATVLSAIEVIAKLKYPVNVDVVIAATDNRIGDNAIVPDDILKAANGLTIEIISTDAEGRLTLADALWFAQTKGATKLIDIATLTGAVVNALGKEYTGVFTNNQDFLNALIATAKKTKEKVWQLPVYEGNPKELRSFSADIRNSGTSRLAGASVAAAFLEKFVQDNRPWIHIDIAGTAFDEKNGASGVMVKTLAKLFSDC